AVELDPQAAEDIASFALSSLTTENYGALRALLEAHVEGQPDNLNTLYSLGVMYLRENELEKARTYLERVRDLAPRDVQAYYNLALLHQRAGREDLARAAMARFRELEAEEERLWQEEHRASEGRIRGENAASRGELDEAIQIFAELVRSRTEETPRDYARLGEALLAAGRLTDARDAFEKGRTQKAGDARALEGLSRVSLALGDTQSAAMYRLTSELLKRRCPQRR
ncbi:MAG: tetratricopeptide repeat protein, partial [Vicinamibacteria bacterium]